MLPSSHLAALLAALLIIIPGGQSATDRLSKADVCERGYRQSPINIDTEEVYPVLGAQPFVFINYDRSALSVEVDDHTVKMKPNGNLVVGVAAGGIRGLYLLDHIHFHWSSEHTVDGNRFPLEVHLVHYNAIYPNVSAALSDPGGLAVIGVLFTEGAESSAIAGIMDSIKQSESLNSKLTPGHFLPRDRSKFFRYLGSLTTSPCSESVIWSVMKSKLTLSPEQAAWFKSAPLTNGPLLSNFRPVQDSGYRRVQLWIASYRNKALNKQEVDLNEDAPNSL